jgi:signal transduction histidine kinase/ligand-binding sensor domain-containing protein
MALLPQAFGAGVFAILISALPSIPAAHADWESIPVSQDYVLRAWDVEDGLPNNNVESITQASDGYLWMATWSGIARFDGLRFTTFAKGSGLDANEVNVVFSARDGTLWAGFRNGEFARRSEGRFQPVIPGAPPSPKPLDNIHSLAEDAAGAIWAGFFPSPKVIRWQQGSLTKLTPSQGVGPGKFPEVKAAIDGTIWLATSEGCGFFDGERFQPLSANDGGDVRIGAALSGGMWVARGQSLLRYWKDGRREVVASLAWLGGSLPITEILEDHDGNLWLGTRNAGLLRFHDGKFTRVPTPSSPIAALCEDREDNLWVGTRGSGLLRLSRRCFFLRRAKTDPVRVLDENVNSVCVDAENRVALAQGFSFVRSEDAANRTFAPPPGSNLAQKVTTVYFDPADGIWLGGLESCIRCWRDGKYTSDEPFPGQIVGFLLDHQKNLWIASVRDGLHRRRPDGTLSRIDVAGLAEPRALAEDSEGRVWAGTESGPVFRQDGETFAPVPLPGAKPGERVQFIVSDGKATLWLGARDGGLYRWQEGRIEKLPPDAGLPADDLKSLEIEPDGTFWFGTGRGLFRVARREIEEVLEGRQSTLRATGFGRANGLPTLNFSFGFVHATARTSDGHLWFATTSGALEVIPQKLRKIATPNPVLIEDFQVNGKPRPLPAGPDSIVLPPQPGSIQIRYTVPQMSAPEQLRFRYRLLGARDDTWYAAENQRTAVFTNLAPGSYTFEVAAAESAHSWQPETASLSFTVQAAWWETFWFRLGCALIGALALAALVRTIVKRRMQARIRRLEQEHALERERSRIARDMHDELGASLTHIMLMSDIAASEPGSSSTELRKIAQTARNVSSTLDEIVWTTNPRNDTLEHLIGYIAEFSEEYLAATGIDLRLELPSEIPVREVSSEKRHQVLLVVKEALNNIVKHANARRVHLHVAFEHGVLRIVIRDDGNGFDPDAIPTTSNGLVNMRQRLAAISGTLQIESQPGRGTVVTLAARL